MPDSRRTFLTAAAAFADQVAAISAEDLSGPGLGEWDLRSLIGHTSRSLVTVQTYLDLPADEVAVPTAAHYYLAVATSGGASGPDIVERGRQAGEALGDDPAAFVATLAARVSDRLGQHDSSYRLRTIAGGMRLDEYLRTRTFELVVHGLDIEAVTGVAGALHGTALSDAVTLAAEVAVLEGRGVELLRAATGRAPLPEDFSVV